MLFRPLQSRLITLAISLTCLGLLAGCSTNAFNNSSKYQFVVNLSNQQIQFTAVAPDSIEVLYLSESREVFPSFAKASKYSLPLTISETNDEYRISTGKLTAQVNKNSGAINFLNNGELLTQQLPFSGESVAFDFQLLADEKLMGGGQRVLGMDRRGHKLPLYNRAHYGYTTESIQMNYSLPAVMSSQKYYLLFDNSASGHLDLAATEQDQLQFRAVGGRHAYIIGADNSYPELIDEFTQVTGRPVMLPRWALGHFISRFGYRTQQEVEEVVALTQAKDIPADAVILDLYWFGPDIRGHMGNLSWDKANFPQPEAMINHLNEQQIQTVLITEPFILTSSDRWQDAVESGAIATNESGEPYRYDFYFGNTGLVDIFSDNGREWFAKRYKEIIAQDVAGHWGDLGEPEVHPDDIQHYLQDIERWVRGDVLHNAYGHEWAKLVYDTQKSVQSDSRPFILMRSGFAGTQRFGIIPWTGDVSRSWGGLKPQVELSLQMSLFGLGYTHSDIGGFAGTEGYDPEMYLRWSQYGIFQPIYRPHAQDELASEVVFQQQDVLEIVRDFIKLRYQLTPYNYTLMYQHTQTGMPLMRPMFFENESNPDWLSINDQYLWGDSFLVKPVTDPGIKSSQVILPEGYWFDYWSDTIYTGAQTVDVPVTVEDIPVLVRAGSFIPMVPEVDNLTTYSSSELILHYYHHDSIADSSSFMYEDNGVSASAITSGEHEILGFAANYSAQQLTINLEHSGNGYLGKPDQRTINLVIHGWKTAPDSVTTNDVTLTDFTFDEVRGQLLITLDWSHETSLITINQ